VSLDWRNGNSTFVDEHSANSIDALYLLDELVSCMTSELDNWYELFVPFKVFVDVVEYTFHRRLLHHVQSRIDKYQIGF
jgi:hypothetical protein